MSEEKKRVTFTVTVKDNSLNEFKKVCNKHYITYSKLINLLMDYTVKIDNNTDIINLINQELIQ